MDIIDREMTPWRKKIKCLQTKRGIGASKGCFDCNHFKDCHKSISKGPMRKGDWTYVGRQYGEASVNGKKAKVLFVSMDRTGKAGAENFEYTQKAFRCSTYNRFHPHTGGVDVELVHLLDKATSREDRCQQFALTNAVRCSPCSKSARAKSTSIMMRNCEPHTKAIIQALEPDIIIAQGKHPRNSMCKLFNLDIEEKYDNGRTGPSYRSVEIAKKEIGADKQALFLLTGHPAHYPFFRWKKGHLPDELKKAFARAREIYSQG